VSRGLADLNAAEVALAISKEIYTQVIGDAPSRLAAASPVDRFIPSTEPSCVEATSHEHPAVLGAGYDVDVAQTSIKLAESSLLPQLSVQGSVSRSVQTDTTLGSNATDQASVIGQLNVPIYDGGMAASQTRQAKELYSQSRLVLEQVRNQARTAVVSAWVSNEGTKVALTAAQSEVHAAEIALAGVRREAQGGQRTTIDVLNAQQDLTNARTRQITAQRDRVIASYTLLSAVGRLDVHTLNLNTPDYSPDVHYHQVRDAWHGLRTPSGQ
jgi:outer membrane protein